MFRFAQTETGRDLREDKGSIERGELGALWGETGSFEAGKLRNKPSILVCAILGKPQPPKRGREQELTSLRSVCAERREMTWWGPFYYIVTTVDIQDYYSNTTLVLL